jgi:hypothetical protein
MINLLRTLYIGMAFAVISVLFLSTPGMFGVWKNISPALDNALLGYAFVAMVYAWGVLLSSVVGLCFKGFRDMLEELILG